ncbi:LysR family transcriptional regulator [Paracoccus laeviglucosivorans]|uniref:Transcriptional regulator, LysR family n=1 Tax=Paracoccus laeviglucosivorans TaxID=1197861 RepID=A0A521FBD3_9RHOB|nr:LysR family transcriptional regulator [Paracoccus laeviglucosivorans]SMO93459.1 transcriptional regulator, LysR family [Paracoccus laeviglucosivorans]
MFELNQLRSFVAIATEMSFRRAAETLNMTQPPLTRQIQLLERDIGVELFDRSGRAIRLTEAGRRFLPEAQDLLRRAEAAALSARRAQSGQEGSVILGFVPVVALGLLPVVIAAVRKSLPGVDLVLREMLTIDQAEALPAGQIDLGLMRLPRDTSRLHVSRIVREPYVLALPRDHPMADKPQFSLQDLHGQDFIMYAPSNGWYSYEMLNSMFLTEGVRPNFVQFLGQSITLLSLVNASEGIALVPDSSRHILFPNVVLRPIELPSHAISEYYLGWSRALSPAAAVMRVRDELLKEFGASLPQD